MLLCRRNPVYDNEIKNLHLNFSLLFCVGCAFVRLYSYCLYLVIRKGTLMVYI